MGVFTLPTIATKAAVPTSSLYNNGGQEMSKQTPQEGKERHRMRPITCWIAPKQSEWNTFLRNPLLKGSFLERHRKLGLFDQSTVLKLQKTPFIHT